MVVENIGCLLNRIVRFEHRLERYYAGIRDRSRNNDRRLLTYYLGRHHHHLPDILKNYSPQSIRRVRKVELRNTLPFIPKKEFPALMPRSDKLSGRDLLEAAIRYDTTLVKLYRKILKQHLIGAALELFGSLLHAEEHDLAMLKKMAAMKYF